MNDTLQQLWKEEDSARAKGIDVDTMMTRTSSGKSVSGTPLDEQLTQKRKHSAPESNTIETPPPQPLEKSAGSPPTRAEIVQPEQSGCASTDPASDLKKSETKQTIGGPPLVVPAQNLEVISLNSEIIASPSMNLLDESANHMFGLMKGLHANQPPAEIRSFDPERVNSAVACANTIYKIMRLKLDAIKVQRKLK